MRLDVVCEDGAAPRLRDLASFYREMWAPQVPPPGPLCLLGQETAASAARLLGWGQMWGSREPDLASGIPWGFDNGAWIAWRDGTTTFPEGRFLERVETAVSASSDVGGQPPLVAVVPDKVQAGMESLEFSLDWLPRCRDLAPGWPWYLAIQGGMGAAEVDAVLDEFDGVFMGGAHEEKSAARLWARVAHDHNLPFHYGGCGTVAKLMHAFEIGADSLDSVSPLWTYKQWSWFLRAYDNMIHQHPDYTRRDPREAL